MGTTPNAAIITRLGYSSEDLRAGLAQAKQDVAKYKEDALRIDAELRRAKLKNLTEFSRENRKQLEEQAAQQLKLIQSQMGSLAHVRGAQKQAAIGRLNELKAEFAEMKRNLGLFDEQRKKVIDLQKAQVEASISVKRSQLAAGLFTQAGPSLAQQIADAVKVQVFQSSLLNKAGLGGQGGQAGFGTAGAMGLLAGGTLGAIVALPALLGAAKAALIPAAKAGGEYADSMTEIAESAGMAREELQKFEAVGRTLKLSAQDIAVSMKTLSAAIVGGGAEDGIEGAGTKGAKVLAALGIATHDNTGKVRSFSDVLLDLADVFEQLPRGPEKVRIAVDLLGRSGQNWIPLLNKGREGIRAFLAEVQDFIPDLGGAANAFDALEVAQAKYDLAMMGFKTHLAERILPTVTDFVEGLSKLLLIWQELGTSGVLKFLATGAVGEFPRTMARTAKALGEGNLQFAPGVSPQEFTNLQFPARTFLAGVRSPGSREDERLAAGVEFATSKIKNFSSLTREAQADAVALNILLLEGKLKEVGAEKELSDELETKLKKLREIWAGDKEAAETKRLQSQMNEAQARDLDLIVERQKAISDADRKTAQTESELFNISRQRLELVDAEMIASQKREIAARDAADNEKLSTKERLEAQKKVNDEVEKSTKLIREQGELSKVVADAFQKIASEALAGKPTRQAPPLMMQAPRPGSFRDFQSELADLRVQEALGVNVLNQELEIRRALNVSLIEQIQLRMASGVATGKERAELEKLLGELKQNREEISRGSSAAFKQSTFGQFLEGMQKISDIVGKFAPSLSKSIGQLFAMFEVFKAIGDQLRLLGGGTKDAKGNVVGGSSFAGLRGIFTGRGPADDSGDSTTMTSGERMQAAMLLIAGIAGGIAQWRQGGTLNRTIGGATVGGTIGMAAGGPVGAAVGAIIGAAIGAISSTTNRAVGSIAGYALAGPIGAFFGFRAASRRAETKRIVDQIKAELKTIVDAYGSGSGTLKATIDGLEKERRDAITRLSGKKGGDKKAKEITDAIDKELLTLKRQQKDILEAFDLKVALAGVPENARETAQSISELAAVLKEAADAGASADQQIRYLNATLDDLKVKLGRDLRSDEQETIDLLMQEIDLQKQREGIIKDAAEAELAVKQKLGISRVLTPAQTAAQEIKKIREQRDEKLKSLDEEAARLKAQVEGRAELFGFTSDELDLQGQRATLLERQLELERSITQEVIARIREQQEIFRQLAAGLIPSLPAGILPPGYAFPAGTTYVIQNPTIAITFTNPPVDAEEAADIIRRGTKKLAEDQQWGAAS